MEKGELSNQISMEEIYGLGLHPEESLMRVRDVLVELFFGPDSKLSPEAMRVAAAFFSRTYGDICYVVLNKKELSDLLGDPELRCLNRVIDEFKHCYIKIKGDHNGDIVELEVAAFQFGYRKNKKDMRVKEFVLGCNQLPEVRRLFTNVTEDHYFTGAFKLYLGLKGNTKNVSRAMKFYWYLKRNVVQSEWVISEQRLRVELNCVDSNRDIKDLVKQVIKPVIASINEYSDLKVKITPEGCGSEHKTVGFKISCSEHPVSIKETELKSVCEKNGNFVRIRSMFSDSEGDDKKIQAIVDEFDIWKEHHKYSDEQALKELSGYLKIARANADKKERISNYVLRMMLNSKNETNNIRIRGTNVRKTGKEAGITLEPSTETKELSEDDLQELDDDLKNDPILGIFLNDNIDI